MPNAVDDKVHVYWGRGVFNSYLSPQFKTPPHRSARPGVRRSLKRRRSWREGAACAKPQFKTACEAAHADSPQFKTAAKAAEACFSSVEQRGLRRLKKTGWLTQRGGGGEKGFLLEFFEFLYEVV